jgi:hypothetical protein
MLSCIDSLSIEVSGHGVQIKDWDGDEDDGLDECSLLCLLGVRGTNGISITYRYLRHGLLRRRSISDRQYTWADCRRCELLWAITYLLANSFL